MEPKAVNVLERKGRGGWVPGNWIGTVERGRKKGWYKIEFIGVGLFEGRRRKKPYPVRPDQVRIFEDGRHSDNCSCGCVKKIVDKA